MKCGLEEKQVENWINLIDFSECLIDCTVNSLYMCTPTHTNTSIKKGFPIFGYRLLSIQ